jgi:hypothetical protein
MLCRLLGFTLACSLAASSLAWGQTSAPRVSPTKDADSNDSKVVTKVPSGVILVKGAWSSASDSATPLPEGGTVAGNVFSDPYFGMTYTLLPDWTQRYTGPPPSDTGRYVLALISPADTYKGATRASELITADDLFFTPFPVTNALEFVDYTKDNLRANYEVERPPEQIEIGGRPFTFFAYWLPPVDLHWYVLATQIRCHTVEVVLNGDDPKLLKDLMQDLDKMKLPAEDSLVGGNAVPVCIKDYASGDNVLARVNPVLAERHFNSIPVRIIIDKEGKVKHIHFLSAFPDQAKAITDALQQWKFRPYLRDGKPVEVETGILFGTNPHSATPAATISSAR